MVMFPKEVGPAFSPDVCQIPNLIRCTAVQRHVTNTPDLWHFRALPKWIRGHCQHFSKSI